ncbi:peptidoglycan editing factor PgeF [Pelagibacteraceae bacterium]|jgi:polyphenol oxidase|nr:peptidoglycan editing factor PgeF [Pelagibacteraceae bacterium]
MFYSKNLKKFKKIKHCFFSRKGGFSKGFYKGLNCGKGSKDKKKNILKNLTYVSQKMLIKKNKLVLMNQTHSARVIEVKKNNYKKIMNSDAIITKVKGIALGVVTADCVPVIIYDFKNEIVGCIHAGWKGAFSGIIKNTVNKIKKINSKTKIFASIGPCIGVKNYEVDLIFYKKFLNKSKTNKRYFSHKNKNKKLFNLRKFVADKLLELKVKIDHVNHDTFKEKTNFFSYRRSSKLKQNDYGRCISIVRLI